MVPVSRLLSRTARRSAQAVHDLTDAADFHPLWKSGDLFQATRGIEV